MTPSTTENSPGAAAAILVLEPILEESDMIQFQDAQGERDAGLPGGTGYTDITQLLVTASEEMELGEILMADGFTLNEAMSAIEIGDSRMDSGAPLPADLQRPEFDPLTPMLPEEVCWILDRTFACEMEWHSGTTLSQTVHTCVYMHHLTSIAPEFIARSPEPLPQIPDRPSALITSVIRAGVLGMVKCCDMAYRELVKGNVHDTEDWQGEKAEISLYEGTPVVRILETLDDAARWLETAEASQLPWSEELWYRIALRKTILSLFSLNLSTKSSSVAYFLERARHHLDQIQHRPIPSPSENSPARLAYDPLITRKLHSVMPLKPLTLPPQEDVWLALRGLLDGWEELARAASCEKLLAWETASHLRACVPRWKRSRTPYLRSAMQSIFSNGSTIFDRFPYLWLVDHFFMETVHVPLSSLNRLFETRTGMLGATAFEELQRNLSKLVVQHMWAMYHNRARNRRHLMKTSVEWHATYDASLEMIVNINPKNLTEARLCESVPLAILHWRISAIRDIILSGFELELYSEDEYAFAYWYLSRVLETHETVIRQLMDFVTRGTPAHRYLSTRLDFTSAIANMASGVFLLVVRRSKCGATRRWTNFMIRYKWAMRSEYDAIPTPDVFRPNFKAFLLSEREVLASSWAERRRSADVFFTRASQNLQMLSGRIDGDDSFRLCQADFSNHLVRGLIMTCGKWRGATLSTGNKPVDHSCLRWIHETSTWFPQCDVDA